MHQISTDNSPIELELISGHLLFADPLYLQHIIDGFSELDTSSLADQREFVRRLEEKLFPWGGGRLLGYKFCDTQADKYFFDPRTLKKWNDDNTEQELFAQQKQITTFSVDTGSFLIIDLYNLKKLIKYITYNSLTDALLTNQLDKYFDSGNNKLGNKGWAYIVSGGVEANSEFDGDGSYIAH